MPDCYKLQIKKSINNILHDEFETNNKMLSYVLFHPKSVSYD